MAIQVPSFLIPMGQLPKPDLSWLDSIAQSGGDIIGEMGMRKSMGKLGATLDAPSSPAGQPQGSFLTNLLGNTRQQPAAAPQPSMSRAAPMAGQPPMPGIQPQAGPSNYRDAIASIESKGSGDYAAVGPTHPKLGRALGRYQVMEANIGPWSQEVLGRAVTPEEFMANPQLQDAIFDGKFQQYVQKFGPEGAAQAWFGGEGGVGQTGRTDSLGTSIGDYGNKFTKALGASGGATDAVNTMAANQPMPVNQMADASGSVLAPAVTPVQRGSVSPETIKQFLQDPNLRELGMKLWEQNVTGPKAGEPWQFVTLPDGTLARANQQTGSVERVGNFAKPQEAPNSYQEFQLAQREGFQGTYADWQKVKSPGTSVTVNNGEGDKFYENLDKKNAETFSAMSESGMQARSKMAQINRLEGLMANAPQGAVGALKKAAGEWGIATEGLSDIQAATAMLEKMVPEQRPPGSGPMSDADIAMFRASLPRILNQPGGNELIMGTMKGIAQYEIQMGEIADQVADRVITPAEGRKKIRDLQNPLANFKVPTEPTPNAGTKKTKTGVQWSID